MYKYSCVIDANGYYKDFVLVVDDEVQHHLLQYYEMLIDTDAPIGFTKPKWNGSAWVEGATDSEIAVIAPTLDEVKAAKKAEIAAARYKDTCGILEINGKPYHIAGDARTAFLGTLAAFQAGALTETVWKLADGTFTTLDTDGFMTVVTAALNYIESCFNREKTLIAAVDACATVATVKAINY